MSYLSSLISQRNTKQSELTTYRKRKEKIDTIDRSFSRDFDGDIANAKTFNDQVSSKFGSGLSCGGFSVGTLCNEISSHREKDVWNDSNMSNSASNISSEKTRCQSEITRLEDEIRRLDRQIAEERAALAAAAASAGKV